MEERECRNRKRGHWYHFKQQSLPAWTPRYTSGSVSPLMIALGVILIPLGVTVLIISSDSAQDMKEMRVDYTDCVSTRNSSMTCAQYLMAKREGHIKESDPPCECKVEFVLPKPIKGNKIYFYYSLENFHQNVRRYVKSRDDLQLYGKIGTYENPYSPTKDCNPYDTDKETGKIYFPSGAIANSMFNDTLQLYFNDDVEGEVAIDQIRRGIAWESDVKYLYKNPPELQNKSHPIWEKFTKPRDWSRYIWDLDPSDPENNGLQNEDFIVWMRVAALSNFQKLYRIIDTSAQDILRDRLPAGKYHLKINYTFEVLSFKGRKGIVLAALSVFGQKNLIQGISLISVGGISVVIGLLFLLCGCSNRHGKGFFPKSDYERFTSYQNPIYVAREHRIRRLHLSHFSVTRLLKIFIFISVCFVIILVVTLSN